MEPAEAHSHRKDIWTKQFAICFKNVLDDNRRNLIFLKFNIHEIERFYMFLQ